MSALLGETEEPLAKRHPDAGREGSPRETPIELLRRNPDQPRSTFDDAELAELAESIRERGVLQPILVRPAPGAPGEFQIVAGERRWRAAHRAGLQTVPVMVRSLDDAEVAEIGIIENVQRTDLNPLEEALGYRLLIERFGRTQEAVARTVGKSRSHVANALRLLNLPAAVRAHLQEGRLSAGHARAIASAPDPQGLAERIVAGDLSVRRAEALARQAHAGGPETPPKGPAVQASAPRDADTEALEQDLSEALGLSVRIVDRGGVGEVKVSYASLDQLDSICQRLSAG